MSESRAVTGRPARRLLDKRRLTTALGKYLFNPIVRAAGSGYVRNIAAPPNVRVLVGGRRSGRAELVPDDDPRARQRQLGRRLNAAVVRTMGTDLLTVRIDLV